MHRDQVRHAATLGVGVAHRVARSLRRDHPDVEVGSRRHDLAVVHVEAMREHQRRALLDVRRDLVRCRPPRSARRAAGSSRRRRCLTASATSATFRPALLDLVPRSPAACAGQPSTLTPLSLRFCAWAWPCAAVADDRHALALDQAQVGVLVVDRPSLLAPGWSWRERPSTGSGRTLGISRRTHEEPRRAEPVKTRGARIHQTRRMRSPRPIPLVPVRTVSRIAVRSTACDECIQFLGCVAGQFDRCRSSR